MTCGVYSLTTPSRKVYIGSSVKAERRIRAHHSLAKRGLDNPKLNNAFRRYGGFVGRIILICRPEDRLMYEQLCIDALKPQYNCSPNATALLAHTSQTRQRLRELNKGKRVSAETKQKLRIAQTGRRHTAEARAKMSAFRKGKSPSAAHRASLSASQKGKTLAPQHRAKLTGGNGWWKGRKHKAETIAKMIVSSLGKPGTMNGRRKSDEARAKLSAALKAAHAAKRAKGLPWKAPKEIAL